jgi:hypothetical protein
MPITPLPDPPSRSDAPATFIAKSDAFLGALPAFADEANALEEDLNNLVSAAFTTTSTTSLLVGTGTKNLTVQTGLGFAAGQTILISRTSAPSTTRMVGTVTSYNSATGALVVSVSSISGSGTFTDWTVSLGPAGTVTAFSAGLLDDADASAALTTLGVSTFIKTLLDDASAATALATLGAMALAGGTFTGNVNFGDANFHLRLDTGNPVLQLNSNAYIAYDRTAGLLRFMVNSTKLASINFVSGEIRSIAAITGSTTVP